MSMRTTNLGTTGPVVSRLGLGCMSMAGSYGSADPEEARATLAAALDGGITLFDTGDFYGDGANEELLGSALASRRDKAVLATKTGVRRTADGLVADGRPDYLRQACDASLRRLRTDHIDLYYLARIDPQVPIEDSVGALAGLVEAGKVRRIGLSEVSAATLRRAHAVHPITVLQTEYSLWERHVEDDVLPALRELSISLVAYSPLGRGLLTGAVRAGTRFASGDFRATAPRYTGANLTANLGTVEAVSAIAADLGATPAQLALAWLLARGTDIVPIPGSSRRTHLHDNLAAIDLRLTPDDLARIDAALPPAGARGDRYGTHSMTMIDQ
ncbi:Predicted oxidoreductase [Amycolatopsis rubida]|uniref:Predicted oxidoreductase n=2 Tax=Amycolatopsis rubida TaxID=112413 RepID=A0A1I5VG42_9PSEU|nr:aldo/keto reductase [Amycolatopsis rubida]SFQ05956.1 Predicted oxidoreductase [Amycolatopsis rubida]